MGKYEKKTEILFQLQAQHEDETKFYYKTKAGGEINLWPIITQSMMANGEAFCLSDIQSFFLIRISKKNLSLGNR